MNITWDIDTIIPIYYPLIEDKSRFIYIYGGAGSGKSQFVAQRSIIKCLREKYYRLIFCRKVGKTIRNSQFKLFKDLITQYGLDDCFVVKETTMEIECLNGNMLIPFGMDDREKIKSIAEPSEVWCEEVTEFEREDINQLNLRLRTTKAATNQIIGTFNPITNEHWLYEDYFVKKYPATLLKTTYLDNPFLPDEYKIQLEKYKNEDENYYKVYCLGEWGGSVKGAIYTHWQLIDLLPEGGDEFYGLDFGFNNPSALVKIKLKDKCSYWKQLIYRSGLTNSDLIQELKNLGIGRTLIYADSAEPQRIEEIYRAGFNIKPMVKGPDSVSKGIDTVKSMPMFITSDSEDIIKEARHYKWREISDNQFGDKEPVKLFDHAMDAGRGAIHTHLLKPSGVYSLR